MDALSRDIPFKLVRVDSNDKLPEQADVVVIGGGIAGISAAYYLAKKGHSVAVIEKGAVAAEQSSRNWGWVRQQNRDERELPLAKWSLAAWQELSDEIGPDLSFVRKGLMYVTSSEKELAGWEKWVKMAGGYGVQSRMVSSAEIKAAATGSTTQWIGGVHSPTDGFAEPTMACSAIAKAAQRHGATMHQNCAARGIETQAGKIHSVVTEKGSIRTSRVLCAAGAWTSMFFRWHGIIFPQVGVRATAFATKPGAKVIEGGFSTPSFTFRPRAEGGYTVSIRGRAKVELTPQAFRYAQQFMPMFKARWSTSLSLGISRFAVTGPEALARWTLNSISPFEKMRVLNPAPDAKTVKLAMDALMESFPELSGIGVSHAWGSWIDSTPDAVATIGPVPQLPGLYVASGFSGHGFGVGPGAGRLAADLITNEDPIVDPTPLRFTRFSEHDVGAPAAM
ncbi:MULTISPECIES: FAD-binding oxidoreductase [Rhizobium/Agrobacterium group]|uniref:NAD(P)/FAD-dependent oxidoreductase n=1 Tax=Rhizobium/Agrobacterium group TaxID=227290 RepID=UPI001E2B1EC1|nr:MULTISPECIES: FAD-binding oxidoreductase [Rhizobium/Agrobacterium group]